MAARDENESEILLGNKQLLAVFAVVALLLAVAFTGGYMLGKGSAIKKAETTAAGAQDAAANPLTKTVAPDDPSANAKTVEAPIEEAKAVPPPVVKIKPLPVDTHDEVVLGAKKAIPEGSPRSGQTFLQVTALTYTQAKATALVLEKQNYRTRIAMKPGTNLYRVLVGPVKDAEDISNTRDSLRKIGFRDVFVQKY